MKLQERVRYLYPIMLRRRVRERQLDDATERWGTCSVCDARDGGGPVRTPSARTTVLDVDATTTP
jgi:hypothetical protein